MSASRISDLLPKNETMPSTTSTAVAEVSETKSAVQATPSSSESVTAAPKLSIDPDASPRSEIKTEENPTHGRASDPASLSKSEAKNVAQQTHEVVEMDVHVAGLGSLPIKYLSTQFDLYATNGPNSENLLIIGLMLAKAQAEAQAQAEIKKNGPQHLHARFFIHVPAEHPAPTSSQAEKDAEHSSPRPRAA